MSGRRAALAALAGALALGAGIAVGFATAPEASDTGARSLALPAAIELPQPGRAAALPAPRIEVVDEPVAAPTGSGGTVATPATGSGGGSVTPTPQPTPTPTPTPTAPNGGGGGSGGGEVSEGL